jgi:hypothetical protein
MVKMRKNQKIWWKIVEKKLKTEIQNLKIETLKSASFWC